MGSHVAYTALRGSAPSSQTDCDPTSGTPSPTVARSNACKACQNIEIGKKKLAFIRECPVCINYPFEIDFC